MIVFPDRNYPNKVGPDGARGCTLFTQPKHSMLRHHAAQYQNSARKGPACSHRQTSRAMLTHPREIMHVPATLGSGSSSPSGRASGNRASEWRLKNIRSPGPMGHVCEAYSSSSAAVGSEGTWCSCCGRDNERRASCRAPLEVLGASVPGVSALGQWQRLTPVRVCMLSLLGSAQA
jgi:hypothetical protein